MSLRDYSVSVKSLAVAVAFAATSLTAAYAADMSVMPTKAPPKELPFFLVNDTSVSFTWYPNATDPGVAGSSGSVQGGVAGQSNSFSKYVATVTHFDVWAYGTNFLNIDYIKSSGADPINGVAGAAGAVEVYGIARSTISGNAVTGTKMFSNFITKDISFEIGGDANTENNQLSPEVRKFDVGANFTINLPGTVLLGVLAQKEWNHNAFLSCGVGTQFGACNTGGAFTGDREFHWAPHLELLISEPLTFIPLPVTWNSFTGVVFPKGTGVSQANLAAAGSGLTVWNVDTAETKTEVFADNRLTLDASKLAWGKPGIWDVYAGYRYWYNKFGTDHNNGNFASIGCTQPGSFGCAPGTSIESTAYVGTTYHFK
jgi:hypothetical protein